MWSSYVLKGILAYVLSIAKHLRPLRLVYRGLLPVVVLVTVVSGFRHCVILCEVGVYIGDVCLTVSVKVLDDKGTRLLVPHLQRIC